MVGAILVCIILWSVFRNKSDAVHSDLSAFSHFGFLNFLPVLIYWIAIFIVWFNLLMSTEIPSQVLLACVAFIVSPSLISFFTSQLGLVKVSYFIGRLSYLVFKRNPHSGGLFRGLNAVHRIRNETKKREALLWLKNRFLNHRGKVYSGDIIIYTIIDCQLNQPRSIDYVALQLSRLNGIGKESIPKPISRYAFRCAIVSSLARDDWRELFRIAFQWDTPANNRLALFVKDFSGAYIFQKPGYSKVETFYRRLFCVLVPVLFTLPKRYKAYLAKQQPEKELTYCISDLLEQEKLSAEQVDQFKQVLLSQDEKEKWMARADELSSWQPEACWEKIEQSLYVSLAQKASTDDPVEYKSYEYYEEIDRHCKSLVYIAQSIALRLQSKEIGSGAQNFIEWYRVRQILEKLETDPQAHLSAFQSIENTVWNWIADLWNIKKEHCLVHYICNYCIPLAEKTGNTEFFRVMTGLTGGQY